MCVCVGCCSSSPPHTPTSPSTLHLLTTGSPRAYSIPDRYHPEEDGAEPRVKQTVLQQHVEFFDYVSGKRGGEWGTPAAF